MNIAMQRGDDRRVSRVMKSKGPRAQSPTTIQACRLLGVLPEELKLKTKDSFKVPGEAAELTDLRYTHYMKRFNSTFQAVSDKRKEILQEKLQDKNQLMDSDNVKEILSKIVDLGPLVGETRSGSKANFESANVERAKSRGETYSWTPTPVQRKEKEISRKTTNYFRSSHESPVKKTTENVTGNDDSMENDLEKKVQKEIEKFNSYVARKQREALTKYEHELKKQQVQEEFMRKSASLSKMEVQREKEKEIKLKREEEKKEKIEETKREYMKKLWRKRKEIEKKLKSADKIHHESLEIKRKPMSQYYSASEESKKAFTSRREEIFKKEDEQINNLKHHIDIKVQSRSEKHEMNIILRRERAKEHLTKTMETFNHFQMKKSQESEEKMRSFFENQLKKDYMLKNIRSKEEAEFQDKMKVKEKKEKVYYENVDNINHQIKLRVKSLNQKRKKEDKYLEELRKRQDKASKIRQQLNELQVQNALDNYVRAIRKRDVRMDEILDNERDHAEKVLMKKLQEDFLRKVRQESRVHSHIEEERISDNVIKLSKSVYRTRSVGEADVKHLEILKDIVPEDELKAYQKKPDADGQETLNHSTSRINPANTSKYRASLPNMSGFMNDRKKSG